MVRTLGNSVGVGAAYVCFVMKGMLFVCMYVDIAAGVIPVSPKGKEFCLNALNISSMNSRPLGRVRGGASPPADAVIATKAEPSEDAIGFLYLFLSCPIPLIHIVKVIAWYDTDFAKCYTTISWLAITISHHEIGFSMCSGVIRLCSGLFAWGRVGVSPTSAITTIIPLLANTGGKGVEVVGNGRGGALRLCYKPTRKRCFGSLRFLTVSRMNK